MDDKIIEAYKEIMKAQQAAIDVLVGIIESQEKVISRLLFEKEEKNG